jgi:hypothetical protein
MNGAVDGASMIGRTGTPFGVRAPRAAIRRAIRLVVETSLRGGRSCTDDGRYERKERARAIASASVAASSSTTPLRVWIALPPSVSLSTSSPRRATTGGPATKRCDVPFTITL